MAKKRVDLKKRLDELRNVPQPPVDLHLRLESDLVRSLRALADDAGQPVEHYIEVVLRKHILHGDG